MIRSRINICLLAVISLLLGVISPTSVPAAVAPEFQLLGQIASGMRVPTRIDLDADGSLYVADSRNQVVFKFDMYGEKVGSLSAVPTSGAGLAVSAEGMVYASAWDKVAIYDEAGAFAGYLGQGVGEFVAVGDIDIDVNGNVYVVDNAVGQVKVFSPGASNGTIFGNLKFTGSLRLSIDPDSNRIYIANYTNDRWTRSVPSLYVYNASAGLLRKTLALNGFGTPILSFGDVAFDGSNRFYISDFNEGTIRVVDTVTGAVALKYGLGELRHPGSMAYDAGTQRLFVLHGDARVDIYGIDGGQSPAPPVDVNTPPGSPSSVTFGEVSSVTPELLFKNATDEDNDTLTYNVQVFDANAAMAAAFKADEATSPALETLAQVDVALDENAHYTWQVQADDGQDVSAWSAAKAIDINAVEEAPTAPVLDVFLSGENADMDAELTWSASSDLDPNATLNYRLEIYNEAILVASAVYADARAPVSALSASLDPDTTYAWKVVAVDNTGLETVSENTGYFVFKISRLNVEVNVPGAKVYLTGHHGYAGRLLGTAPVEVRGLPAGTYALVIELAGFKPSVTLANIVKDEQTEVSVRLQGARLAADFVTHDLNLAGQAVKGVDVAPILADLNYDGVLDLLLANQGQISFYAGSLVQDPQASDALEALSADLDNPSSHAAYRLVFAAAAQSLGLPQISGAAPCLVDWDNDDRLDLVVGGADGSVRLFRGQGGATFSADGEWLATVGGPVRPTVGDFEGDGDKDLVLAYGTAVVLLDNVGTDALPVLNSSKTLALLADPAVPLFVDWDADGTRELLLLTQGELYQAQISNGMVSGLSTTGLNVAGASSLFVANGADSHHRDLIFGTAGGALVVANGQAGSFAPAYVEAVMVKLAEVERLVALEAPERLNKVDDLAKRIAREDFEMARLKAEQLVVLLDAVADSADASAAVSDLAEIL